jgi:hypothetical protein
MGGQDRKATRRYVEIGVPVFVGLARLPRCILPGSMNRDGAASLDRTAFHQEIGRVRTVSPRSPSV